MRRAIIPAAILLGLALPDGAAAQGAVGSGQAPLPLPPWAERREPSPQERYRARFPQPVEVGRLLGLEVTDADENVVGHVRDVVRMRAFTPLSTPQVHDLEALFARVFAGDGSPEEARELATRYDCRLVVLTATDRGWGRDPFARSPSYRLVEAEPGRWRLYKAMVSAH